MNGNNSASLIRAIRGPVTLITVGTLFALNNFTPYGFHQTWPVLLIVFGLLSLLRRGTERPAPMPASESPAFQPYAYPPPHGAGSYRQTQYPPYTPPPPPRGGFGTSAAPNPGEPPQTSPPGDSL